MYKKYNEGYIEVIWGPMFSGKTSELIRRVITLEYAKEDVIVFKPAIDNRYEEDFICSHTGHKIPSYSVKESKDIFLTIIDTNFKGKTIAIDEVQFFDEYIVDVVNDLAEQGYRVMCAGLDQDFRGVPFRNTSMLAAIGEFNTKLSAFCAACGAPATMSQRLVDNKPAGRDDPVVVVGASESYEARCRHCHEL